MVNPNDAPNFNNAITISVEVSFRNTSFKVVCKWQMESDGSIPKKIHFDGVEEAAESLLGVPVNAALDLIHSLEKT